MDPSPTSNRTNKITTNVTLPTYNSSQQILLPLQKGGELQAVVKEAAAKAVGAESTAGAARTGTAGRSHYEATAKPGLVLQVEECY